VAPGTACVQVTAWSHAIVVWARAIPEIDEAAIHRMTAIQPPALSRENTSKWTVGEVDPGGGRRRENLDGFGEAYWQTPPLQTPPVHPVPFGAG